MTKKLGVNDVAGLTKIALAHGDELDANSVG
jgi:hypothetical protein